jgi:hypothetical protein
MTSVGASFDLMESFISWFNAMGTLFTHHWAIWNGFL